MERCFDQLKSLFDSCVEIESVGFWIDKGVDGEIWVNDEDIAINGERWDSYCEPDSEKIASYIGHLEYETNGNKILEKLDKEDLKELKELLDRLNRKYTSRCNDVGIVKAVQEFDFSKINTKPFIKFYGERAFNKVKTAFFTVEVEGNIKVDGEDY